MQKATNLCQIGKKMPKYLAVWKKIPTFAAEKL
jgi:hypothetical protein